MKDMILKKGCDIFLKFGFKSVTMDDIANSMAISKKTIYKYFKNKEDLVDQTISHMHNDMHEAVTCICDQGFNAIEENFEIKKMFRDMLKNSDDSPMFQLQKYYPRTFNRIMKKEFSMFKDCIINNLSKGMEEGLYRQGLNIELVSKFYFSLVMSVHDANLYQYRKNTINKLEMNVLEYHTRAIATKKGLEILEEQLDKTI